MLRTAAVIGSGTLIFYDGLTSWPWLVLKIEVALLDVLGTQYLDLNGKKCFGAQKIKKGYNAT